MQPFWRLAFETFNVLAARLKADFWSLTRNSLELWTKPVPSFGTMKTVSEFISHHFRHFNAATLKDAAQGYRDHLDKGGKMLVTVGGRHEYRRIRASPWPR